MDGETKATRRRRIAITTPAARYIEADFTASLLRTVAAAPASVSWLHVVGHANLPRARNVLVAQALKLGFDDIVFIDADIGWEPEAFTKLFDVPEEVSIVAGAPQRRQSDDLSFCAAIPPKTRVESDLVSGFAATAFLRVKAHVFRELAPYVEAFDYRGMECRAFFNYELAKNPVSDTVGFVGEDYYFSTLARKHGIAVWIDPTIALRHWHTEPMTEMMVDHIEIGQPEKAEG